MKKQLLFAALLFAGTAFSQQGNGGKPASSSDKYLGTAFDSRSFAEPDVEALRAEDALVDGKGIAPWRFGYMNLTDLTLENSGTWASLPDGSLIWRLRLNCANATTVNLLLDNVSIPEGNELYVYNPEKSFILGSFTAEHLYDGNLGTELVPGGAAIVEYYVPAANKELIRSLRIHTVTHGYRSVNEFLKGFDDSGNCNMNVNCPDGAGWVNQRNSTVMLVSGGQGFCTGSLVNNTENNGKPYILTANHCFSNPANWVFRFNWQSAGCTNGAEPSFLSLSGAVLRARRTPSDFCLVEITGGLTGGLIPQSYNAYLSGWDHSGDIPSSTVGIHHPSGDIKKISFDDAAPFISQAMGSSEPNSTWSVEWDRNTTTEGGSSGSPLYDQNHRVIGQLWGGGASCSSLNANDFYGRFSSSWEPAGSNSTNQLKFWLDPNNTGGNTIDGYDPFAVVVANDASLGSLQGATGRICSGTVQTSVTITNEGTATLTSATITYGAGGAPQTYSWTGSLAQHESAVVMLPSVTSSAGDQTFTATVSQPNGVTDENAVNNVASSAFTSVPDGLTIGLELQTDCYGDETDWEVRDAQSNVLYSGGVYQYSTGGQLINEEFCLAGGCYTFVINDVYGDGMSNSDGSCSQQQGHYIISQGGMTLAQLTEAEADFGFTNSRQFCISGLGINELQAQWAMFPNPSDDKVTLDLSAVDGTKEIAVTTSAGQIVRQLEISSSSEVIDISQLAAGMYLVSVKTSQGSSVRPLIVR
jgi:lysyl endopeptidase